MQRAEDISHSELEQVVGNLEELKRCHQALLPQLETCATSGQILIRLASTLEPYIPYIANRTRAAPLLLSIRDKPGFAQVMRV
jgi:hypothetical protein